MARALSIIVVLAVATFAGMCLLRPATILAYVMRTQSNRWAWRLNPFRDWMTRPSYRTHLRFMGVFVLLWALVGAIAIVMSH